MSRDSTDIGEFDLLAYVDGRLARDPERRAAVERYLEHHPETAARIAQYEMQHRAIRAAFDPILGEPVPERLRRVMETPPRRRGALSSPFLAASVLAAVLFVGAAAGWMLANESSEQDAARSAFVDEVAESATNIDTLLHGSMSGSASVDTSKPFDWLSRQIAIGVALPDLTDEGLRLLDKSLVDEGRRPMVRLVYVDQEGRRFAVFLRPRWHDDGAGVRTERRNGVRIAHWVQGPIVYGVTAIDSEGAGAVSEIAERLRRIMQSGDQPPPFLDPSPRMPMEPGREARNQVNVPRLNSPVRPTGGDDPIDVPQKVDPAPTYSVN